MALTKNPIMTTLEPWLVPIDIFNIICCGFATLLAMFFLFIIIFDKLYNTIVMVLVTNSCVAGLGLAISFSGISIFRLYNDLKSIYFYDSVCLIISFISYVSLCVHNYCYLLLTIYRYVLVVYPSQLFYQSFKFQGFLIGLSWLFSIIYPIPLITTNQLKYSVEDQICQIPLGLSFLTIFNAFLTFFVPMLSIIIIYIKMVRYVQEMSKNIASVNRLFHAKRELKMIKRIVSLVLVLLVFGTPYSIFMMMSFFNSAPKYHLRIVYTFISVAVVFILFALLQMAEPLKTSIMKRINVQQTNAVSVVT